MFKEDRELVEDARTDAQVAKVKKVLDSDRRLTIDLISRSSKDIGSTPSRRFKRQRRQRLSTVFRKPTSRFWGVADAPN